MAMESFTVDNGALSDLDFWATDPDADNKRVQGVVLAAGESKIARGAWQTTTSLLSTGLNGLAASNTAGYASNEVDMSAYQPTDVIVYGKFQMTTSGSPTGLITVYLLASLDGTDYTGDTSYSGSAAAYTLGAANSANLVPLFTVKPHANTNTYLGAASIRQRFGSVPPFWAVVVLNDANSVALHSSGSEITYRVAG
jgi:hypothetical protein